MTLSSLRSAAGSSPSERGSASPTGLIDVQREQLLQRAFAGHPSTTPEKSFGAAGGPAILRVAFHVLVSAICYYVATQIAWSLCFPDSKVSLFFPPHAVLVSILLLVPTRHWWVYVPAAAGAHFLATQQAHWPALYALHCEVYDAVKAVAAAAGVRALIRSPIKSLSLRDAVLFVLVAAVLVPFVSGFWGAALTLYHGFGVRYWIEWRNLGISNAVTTVVLVPAILLGAHHLVLKRPKTVSWRRSLEAALLVACMAAVGTFVFDKTPAGPGTSPALLYTPIPLLIWAAMRFGLGGISASMLVITYQAIWGTMRGHGPFLDQTPVENALALQLFLLMTATPLMLLAVVIEEERRSQAALRESKDRMGYAAEAAQLALWVWDVNGDEGWMTARGRSMLGFGPGERIDYSAILDRVHPEDRAARECAIRRALETHGEYEMEYRVLHPDGGVRWISARGRCEASADGVGAKLFGVSMDVTAIKQAEVLAAQEREELQRKRAELEHVARVATLGELTATLTHELKQPLSAVLANAFLGIRLLDDPEVDLKEVREALSDISEITTRAGDVIQGLRDMLKRDTPGFADVDVNQLVRTVERIVHSDAVSHRVKVQFELSNGLLPVHGDSVQLQQVMLNLMLNAFGAMKAIKVGGERRLIVRTTAVEGSLLRIDVQDSGTGIAPEKLESIFEPFVTGRPEGLGMGLSICRTIIERHAGRISASNNPGGGATFTITLPARVEAGLEAAQGHSAAATGNAA